MQIPFCSSVTMAYCSLSLPLSRSLSFTLSSSPTHSAVYLASISRISSFHYLCRLISGTSFPLPLPLFQPECAKKRREREKKRRNARPRARSCAVAALEREKPNVYSDQITRHKVGSICRAKKREGWEDPTTTEHIGRENILKQIIKWNQ